MAPVQMRGQVLGVRKVGAYHLLSFVAPAVADTAAPGQFVALAVGGEATPMLLRRAFSIYRASRTGTYGGTVEVVVGVHGAGTAWLAERAQNDVLDVVGPLGRPFSLPEEPEPCVLVGGGYGSAPLFSLAAALRSAGCRVDYVLGAGTDSRLFGALEAKRSAATLTVTTEDGSAGVEGRVSDVLPEVLERSGARRVYACGPMGMLAAVARQAGEHGAASECAVEESMACGVGVCMTCVLPVVGEDGVTRMTRSCVDGPVFDGARVRWDDVGTVPPDTWGAPVPADGGPPAEEAADAAGGRVGAAASGGVR